MKKAAAGLLCLVACSIASGADGATSDASANWTAVSQCAKQGSARARHDCVDRVLRDAGVLTPEMRQREQRQEFGSENVPPAPRVVAPSPASPARVPDAPPERLEAELATVTRAPDGRVVLTTRDGAVWQQNESQEITLLPKAGERLAIRKGSLGAYLCTLESRVSFRCRRVR